MANSCIITPNAKNNKPSKLYKDLLKVTKNRAITNLIYATYLSNPAIANNMDTKGYTRNLLQDQHKASDLLEFLDYNKWKEEVSTVNQLKKQYNIVDDNYNNVHFSSAIMALKIADKFNTDMSGLVANVLQHIDNTGNTYYDIIVREKDTSTLDYKDIVSRNLKVWDIYKQTFLNKLGVDIDNTPQAIMDIISPINSDLVTSLNNIKKFLLISGVYKKDALLMFFLNMRTKQVQQLVRDFGSIEAAADAISDFNTHKITLSKTQRAHFIAAFNECKKFNGLDITKLKNDVDAIQQSIQASSDITNIRKTLKTLNAKYNISKREIHLTDNKIKTLSQAVAESVYNIKRRIREVQKEEGYNSSNIAPLNTILNDLYNALGKRNYYYGIMEFLSEANTQISKLDDLLNDINSYGNDLDSIMDKAKALYKMRLEIKKYKNIIEALADENTEVDESLSQQEIDDYRQLALNIKKSLSSKERIYDTLAKDTMKCILIKLMKNNESLNEALASIDGAVSDASVLDTWLYAMSRCSKPLISALGGVISKAKVDRNDLINDFDTRITKATKKLYAAGSNTKFMYESNGHIISDIDWDEYLKNKYTYKKSLDQTNLSDLEKKVKMQEWIDNNTEDRLVDAKNNRYERVPDNKYRKAFPDLTAAQKEYYDTVMQIKGEIGTLLPAYAQNQYLPAQMRRNMTDALSSAKSVRDVYTAFKNKAQDAFKVREDDEYFNSNGIIDGEEYNSVYSDYNDAPKREIPIFFVNKLKDQRELLKDFSAGLNALAGTAINYDAMHNIEDAVLFMGDFIEEQTPRDERLKADVTGNKVIQLVKNVATFGKNTGTSEVVTGFINHLLYGMNNQKSSFGNKNPIIQKIAHSIIAYTSFKGLTTNLKGMVQNALMGEFQMFIECGAGEFYNLKDYALAHARLVGNFSSTGEIWDLINNTKNSKAVLLRETFDPESENFKTKTHKRYHKNFIRRVIGHDLSFIGYGIGEYLIHMIGMYSCLYHEKVLLNGKKTSLYNALEVVDKGNGAAKLQLKSGVTKLDGSAYTKEDIDQVKRNIKYSNDMCHGDMSSEGKGLIYQHYIGAAAMNFRQWMVETYSRRFRGRHYDATLGRDVEGFWDSVGKGLWQSLKDNNDDGGPLVAFIKLIGNIVDFGIEGKMHWATLDDIQKKNFGRAHNELIMLLVLCGVSLALGDPKDDKGNFSKRFWQYQVKRSILDLEAGMPSPYIVTSNITILNSPIAGINTVNGLLYYFIGLINGDVFDTVKTGEHKGENRYVHNIVRQLPFVRDYRQMKELSDKDNLFNVFKLNVSSNAY